VDIVAERLSLLGYLGVADTDAVWTTLRNNHIEAMQKDVHREALSTGTSYVSVWDDLSGDGPKVAYESSLVTTHENVPGDSSIVAAAIKVWYDSINGYMRAALYLPDVIVRYRSVDDISDPKMWMLTNHFDSESWAIIDEIENPYGRVTIVPFVTHPSWSGYGRSDLVDIVPVIQRIETLTLNTLLGVELGAFRQKWATGIEIPLDDNGNPIEPYKAALDRLWISEDPDARFGVFQDTDVRPYLQAVEDSIGQLSAVSRIPALYFNQSGLTNPPSASSLEASETGLVNKVLERRDRYAESWESVGRLVLHDEVGMNDLSTTWKDPRTQSDAQVVDAAVKLDSIGLPWEAVMEFIGYTPEEISRLKTMRSSDVFMQLLNTPLPQATPLVRETPAQVVEPPVA
jgi:hypothetical protein